jgi:hypothetical protein
MLWWRKTEDYHCCLSRNWFQSRKQRIVQRPRPTHVVLNIPRPAHNVFNTPHPTHNVFNTPERLFAIKCAEIPPVRFSHAERKSGQFRILWYGKTEDYHRYFTRNQFHPRKQRILQRAQRKARES